MRRRINFKPILVLVGTVIVVSLIGYLVHAYQIRRNAAVFLEQADRAEQRGDFSQAADYLLRYLAMRRNDAAIAARYAMTLDRGATTVSQRFKAFFALEHALRLDPSLTEARLRQANLALSLRRHPDARKHLEILSQTLNDNVELQRLFGECDEQAGEFERANRFYSKAIELDPTRVEIYVRQAMLMRRKLDRAGPANRVMDEMILKNPRSVPALLARSRYRREFGRASDGAPDMGRALELAPDDADVRLAAAEQELAMGRTEEARKHLATGRQRHPQHLGLIQALARLEAQSGDPNVAIDAARKAIPILADQPKSLADTINLLIDTGDGKTARELLARPEGIALPQSVRDYLRGRLALQEEKWLEARALLARSRPDLSPAPELRRQADLMLAICHRQLGNPDAAATAARAALDPDASWLPARIELAAATHAQGRIDEALTLYRNLVDQAPASRLAIVRILLVKNFRLPPEQRRWDEVERMLDGAPDLFRELPETILLKAEYLLARDRSAAAKTLLESACRSKPKQAELRLALVQLVARDPKAADLDKLLAETEREIGDGPALRLVRARQLIDRGGANVTAGLDKLADGIDRWSKPDQIRYLAGLTALTSSVDGRMARRFGSQLAELTPARTELHFTLLRLALADNDEAAARRYLNDLRKVEGPEGPLTRCSEAAMMLQFPRGGQLNLDEIRDKLIDVARQRPGWGLPHRLLAEVHERKGELDAAISHYRASLKMGERSPALVRRVVQLLHSNRRYEEAQTVLRELNEQEPLSDDLQRLAASAMVGYAPAEQILEQARRAVPSGSKDYRDQLWLGQLFATLRRYSEAEEAYRKATTLAPTAAETWVSLLSFYAGRNDSDKATAAIEEAQKHLKPDIDAIPLSSCWEAVGRRDKAIEIITAAVEANPTDLPLRRTLAALHLRGGNEGAAKPSLERLAHDQGEIGKWAKRNLAVLLARTGGVIQLRDAQRLADDLSGDSPEDRRAKAIVLAYQPTRRREAIAALEQSFIGLPVSPDEQFLLARLYDADRKWDKARDLYQTALTATRAPDPRYLASYLERLLARNELADAPLWLKLLRAVDPDGFRSVAFEARVQARTGRLDVAVRRLLKFAETAPPESALAAARLIEELGQPSQAEPLVRKLATVIPAPNGQLTMARFLAASGQPDEAISVAEQAGTDGPTAMIAATAYALVRNPKTNERHRQRIKNWLELAQGRRPRDSTLILARADLAEWSSDWKSAAELYQSIPGHDANFVAAINNLAVLRALQGDGMAAVDLAEEAIRRAGPVPALLDTRAIARLKANQKADDAIRDLEEAIAMQPTAVRYFHLTLAFRAAGNRTAADDSLTRARDLGVKLELLHPLERNTWTALDAGER